MSVLSPTVDEYQDTNYHFPRPITPAEITAVEKRQYLNGYELYASQQVLAGHTSQYNAERNVDELFQMFTLDEVKVMCQRLGIQPISELRQYGPFFPPLKRGLSGSVQPNPFNRENSESTCSHYWVVEHWDGLICNDCGEDI